MIASPLTVVSWNVQFGTAVDAAIATLTSDPQLRVADVLLLQEMDGSGVERIANALDMDHWYQSACVHPKSGRDFGNAVLARESLRNQRMVPLPHQSRIAGTPRIAVGADTTLDGVSVALWSVHTEVPTLGASKRTEQYAESALAAGTAGAARFLIGGDFNTATRRSISRLSTAMDEVGADHLSRTAGPSLVRARRALTLDHLFARGLTATNSGTVDVPAASDHRALWATVRLRGEETRGPAGP